MPRRNATNLKVGLEKNFDEGGGRICSLPDAILHHVLSFLPTKDAVKTSILSKRWEFLWTSITKFDFDEEVCSPGPHYEKANRRRNFMDFVDRVLLLCDSSNIERFSLSCELLADQSRIRSWLYAAVRRKVQRLSLRFPLKTYLFTLPRCLFTCESLKELNLAFGSELKLPSYICFPNLKILSLSDITFRDDHSAQQLFSSCPNLVKLTLTACQWKNVKAVHISAPMLESVDIFEDSSLPYASSGCEFMISGMELKCFRYSGRFENDFFIFDAPSLDEATFEVPWIEDIENYGRIRIAAYRGYKLFKGLSYVKSLQVSPASLQLLVSAKELVSHLPSLYNLNHLVVDNEEDEEDSGDFACRGLMNILQNSPNLESLDFRTGINLSTYNEKDDWTMDPVPPCFLTHLNTVKFQVFNASDEELHVVKTLLRTARVLEKLCLPSKWVKKIDDLLLTLPKGSVNCDVVFF